MTTQEIIRILKEKSMETAAKEIYKLHLKDKINSLETMIEHPNKPGYKRHDVLDKIKQLKKELKELQ